MLWVVLASLRERRVSSAGAFLTQVFGVAMTSAAGVVISASDARRASVEPATGAALAEAGNLLALFAGLSGFLTVFVVASTVSFTVSQRRREFALLRMAGATPGQVLRLVQGEALAVGAVAAAAGALLGLPSTSVLVRVLIAVDVLPEGTDLPLVGSRSVAPMSVAFALGLLVALLGAWPAARRAGATKPVEAFRDAAVDTRPLPLGRRLLGFLALGAGVVLLVLLPEVPVEGRLPLALFVAQPLVVGLALLAPAVVPRLTALVVAPFAGRRGVSGMLARENLRTAVRRTASCAAPVLVTIGVTGSLLAGTELLGLATSADAGRLYTSDYRVTGADLDPAVVRAGPGVRAAVVTEEAVVTAFVNRTTRDLAALGVTPDGAPDVLGLGRVTGDLGVLTGETAALSHRQASGFGVDLGDALDLRLADGARVSVRVVALYEGPPLTGPVLLPADLVGAHRGPSARERAALHVATSGPVPVLPGADVVPTREWLSTVAGFREEGMRIGARLLAWFALLYTLFAVANTVVMSFGPRSGEFALLRLLGASRRQVLRMVLCEGVGIAVTGVVLGGIATGLAVGGLWQVLRSLGLDIPLALPWGALAAIAAGCAAVLLTTSVIASAVVLRSAARPPTAE